MKCWKYFGAKRHGFIKSESILAPKGASHFKNENIKCDTELALNIHLRHKGLPGYADFEKCITIGFVLIDPGTRPLMPVLKNFFTSSLGLGTNAPGTAFTTRGQCYKTFFHKAILPW
jgi:hypothetical protein